MKRQKVEELIFIRAVCALGIFMIHLSGSFAMLSAYGSKAMHLGIIVNQFFRFGTPVFMIISGFVLFYNYRSFEEFDAIRFYNKKLKYILLPYLLWSFLYCFIFPYILWTPFSQLINSYNSISIDFIKFVKIALLGNAYPHLYFIFLIFQFYLLYPVLMKCFIKAMKNRPLFFFVMIAITQGVILIYEFSFRTQSSYQLLNFFNMYYWKSVFGWFFYFLTGGLIALHYNKISKYIEENISKVISLYLLSAFLYIGEVYYNIFKNEGRDFYEKFGSIRPTTMIYSVCTIAVLILAGRKIHNGKSRYRNIIKACGTYSLGIYFLHPFILELIKVKIINKYPSVLGYSRISTLIFLVITGWSVTVMIVLLLSKNKLKSLVIGKVPAFTNAEFGLKGGVAESWENSHMHSE
ncbi:MAG: acyltransferase [Clostridiales bacterium]|nr:acyltransferase [Clostridiales bacterium]